eukprot:TRINITY_DN8707_c0_g1_i2.p1 TRINITY_DN8707_c0_g1~~TRINITY_DN8707_c0_g1_i2.p1  ORF type:complete len:534 (-),score=103.05 TRINITY_DN8707_c0_g1_i2:421-2022(-)
MGNGRGPKVEGKGGSDNGDICVRGLAWVTREDGLRKYFEQFGKLTTCTVKEDADGRSRGYGFVNFEDPALVDQVMAQQEHVIDGRKVELRPPLDKEERHAIKKVFIGMVPANMTPELLEEHFSQFGKVTDVFLPKPNRGFAFVTYEKGEAAKAALNTAEHMVGGHKLQVKLPTPKMTAGPAQQLNPFQKAQMLQHTQQMQYAQQAATSQGMQYSGGGPALLSPYAMQGYLGPGSYPTVPGARPTYGAMYPDPQQYAAYGLLPDFANFHIGQPQQPGHSTGQPSQPIQQLGAQQPGFQQQSGHPSGFQGGQVDHSGAQQMAVPGGALVPGRNQPGTQEHSDELSNGSHPGLPSSTDFATYTGVQPSEGSSPPGGAQSAPPGMVPVQGGMFYEGQQPMGSGGSVLQSPVQGGVMPQEYYMPGMLPYGYGQMGSYSPYAYQPAYGGARLLNTTQLFITNLPYSATWQELKDFFKQYGHVHRAEIILDESGKSKGRGTVRFSNNYEATHAMMYAQNALFKGRPLSVREDRQLGSGVS